MAWSIAEVARESGVTSRTLRHYDAIGLLPPAWTADSGRRFYEEEQLLRLQQILLLRNLGLGLDAVAEMLERQSRTRTVEVLQRHRAWLVREQERLARLAHTVDATIENIREGGEMAPEKVFEGFEHNPYEAEAREMYGDAVVDDSWARLRGLSDDDAELARTGYTRVHDQLAPLMADGVDVSDRRVQDVVALHHRVTTLFWTPDAAAFRGLGQMYVDDERFHEAAAGGDAALAAYLRDAMSLYADRRLA